MIYVRVQYLDIVIVAVKKSNILKIVNVIVLKS